MMIEHSADFTTLATALVSAQSVLTGAKRDAKNAHFRSSYATLENVIESAKPALQANGIAFIQAPGMLIDGALEVTTMLVHGETGQWIRSTLHVPLQKHDPQGVGSAITYACRYSLMAMLGLPPTDDDGEAAMVRGDDKPLNLPKPKSSAELKRNGDWDRLKADLDSDLADANSLFALDKLRKDYRERAKAAEWPKHWLEALANEFANAEEAIKKTELRMAG
jgi:hypothetical protein